MIHFFERRSVRIALAGFLVLACVAFVVPVTGHAQTTTATTTTQSAPAGNSATANAASTAACGVLTFFIGGASCSALAWFVGNLQAILSWILYFVIWVFMTFIGGPMLALEGWFLEFILVLNTQIVNSPIVKFGFSVSLALANLGFVLAIIIIAIMTILRVQSYGAKSLLAKVIAAAIAVNFSLILAGTIMNFSDSLSLYLVRQATPDCGSDTSANDQTCLTKFSNAIAGVAQPQRAFVTPTELSGTDSTTALQHAVGSAGDLAGSLVGIWIAAAFLAGSLIVLGFVTFMFLMRYLWIAMLLVLMPFAWLLWIFPTTKSSFSKWWSKFLKWTFYGPLVLFFLYLAMQTASAIGQWEGNPSGTNEYGFATPGKSGAVGYFNSIGGSFLSGLVGHILPAIIVLGTMGGGVFAANSLGATGAAKTIGLMKGAGKSIGSWTAQRGKARLDRVRTMGTKTEKDAEGKPTGETTTALQRLGSRIATNRIFGKIPGVEALAGSVAAYGKPSQRFEKDSKRYEDRAKNMDNAGLERKLRSLSTGDAAEVIGFMKNAVSRPAFMGRLMKDDTGRAKLEELTGVLERNGQSDMIQGNSSLARYQQHKAVRDPRTGQMMTLADARTDDDRKVIQAQLIAEATAKSKEPDKLWAGEFAKRNINTNALETPELNHIASSLSLNNGQIRKIAEDNSAAMENIVATLTQMRTFIEEHSGTDVGDMDVNDIRDQATAFLESIHPGRGYTINDQQARNLQRVVGYINNSPQARGYEIPSGVPEQSGDGDNTPRSLRTVD
jgi:hypothetical protein